MTSTAPPTDPAAEPAFSGLWSRPYRGLTLGLTLTVTFAAFEALAVATILPAVVKDLGGLKLYGWVFSAFMLANLVGIVVAGGEADRQGPARPFLLGIGLFVLGLVVAGTAPTMAVVVGGRAVQGFGAGILSSLAYVSIGRGYPARAQPRMLAVLSTAWVVPGLIGPALAGIVADQSGWRWVFLGLAPLPLVAAGMALPALRLLVPVQSRPPDHSRTRDALRLAAGAGLAMTALDCPFPLALLLALVGGALGGPALRRLLPPGTLTARPGMPAAIVTTGLMNVAFFGVDAFVPLALTSVRGQSLTMAGLALTAATLTWTAGAWLQAHLAARQSRRLLVSVGLLLIAAGILGAAGALAPAVPPTMVVAAWGLAGLGMGLAYSTNKLVVLEMAPKGQEGTNAASMQLVNVLGTAMGTGLGGAIVGYAGARSGSPRDGILAVDVVMAFIAVVTVLTASRLPGHPAPE